MQRALNFAIVDEVDSILIDEARTPLIISGRGDKSTDMYGRANQFVQRLHEGEENDYVREEKEKTICLTEEGVRKARDVLRRGKPHRPGESASCTTTSWPRCAPMC